MQFGLQFPAGTIGREGAAIRDWAQTAEGLGYAHLTTFEHIVSVKPGASDREHRAEHHELFTLYSFIAGVTERIGLLTAVVVLPLRQTVVVAKQAAEVDGLSGGRLRLGVSVGRTPREYEAAGMDYHTRGKRFEEQIELMRRLWTEEFVTFEGQWDSVTDVGVAPLPVQRPIPIWTGGGSKAVLERTGRIGDGWLSTKLDGAEESFMLIKESARKAGRDPNAVEMEGRLEVAGRTPQQWIAGAKAWAEAGATRITVRGDGDVRGDLELAERVKAAFVDEGLWA